MKKQEYDILNKLSQEPYINQRILSESTDFSLGKVNQSLKKLIEKGYLNLNMALTDKTYIEIEKKKAKNAIILAAGFGMRMIPINKEVPKGLLNVYGEVLIERIIRHLHEVGIYEIDIVVGFMKERYEYLIDKYDVNLVYNGEYATKNNIHSLNLVLEKIENTYIIPCDIYCGKNPFSKKELYSWYMVNDMVDDDSSVRVNRKMELAYIPKEKSGNGMIGISYILKEESEVLKRIIKKFCEDRLYDDVFWEEALFNNGKMIVYAKVVSSTNIFEINTFEQLREIDDKSLHLDSKEILLIADVLNTNKKNIRDITMLKKGMTNRSFKFTCKNKKYIMRIPGEGTDKMINRHEEYEAYKAIDKLNISDHVIYLNPENGYKITEFIEDTKQCDASNFDEVKKCIEKLKILHNAELKVDHEFDLYDKIEYYEKLWNGEDSIYKDYKQTKENIYNLKSFIDNIEKETILTHMDAVPDNFLITEDDIKIIDWEYASMQDPHIDIAMFSIYSFYYREQIDRLIDIYFEGNCDNLTRTKIYAYIAISGLIWSNWCEYKRMCGVEFGEYSLRQYRYAKDYYKIAKDEMERMSEDHE